MSTSLVRSLPSLDRVVSVARAEGSASDPSREAQATRRTRASEASTSIVPLHPSEENQRADERGHR